MMLVHSHIYYKVHTNVISDDTWQRLANELRELQEEFSENINWYDDVFKGWNGDTGMHLPSDEWVVNKALYIIRLNEEVLAQSEKEEEYFYY